MGVNTILTHSGRGDQSVEVRSVNPVVMRASTILFKDYDTWQKYRKLRATDRVLSYGARGTTTNFELEKLICELEGGYRAQLFPTGLAALAMVLLNYAEAGAHFIVSDAIYGPVRTVCNLFLSKVKVDVTFCKADCSDVESLIQPNTKLILVESPGSILYEVIDLPKLCKIAHAHNIPVAIDNTYSSGYLYNPLKLGADISVIAATKYLSGHSDVTMGVVVCNEKEWKNFDKLPEALGFTTSPDDCYLVLRGMRTLAVRMNQIEKNTDEVVAYLQTRPLIGIQVGKKDPATYGQKIVELANSVLETAGAQERIDKLPFVIHSEYVGPGYEKPYKEANDDIRYLARTEGIFTDPVYSGKAFHGLMDLIRTGSIPKGSNVVFLHTGGATALFSEPDIIGDLNQIQA